MYSIPWLPWDYFNFEAWRNCPVWEALGIRCRKPDIISAADLLRRHAIGYCRSEELLVRPKRGEVAVMFLIGDRMGWTHLRSDEFEEVFRVG